MTPETTHAPAGSIFWKPRQPLFEAAVAFVLGIVLAEALINWSGWGGWSGSAAVIAVALAVGAGAYALLRGRGWPVALWLLVIMAGLALHGVRTTHSPARLLAAQLTQEGAVLSGEGVVDERPVPGRSRVNLRLERGTIHGEPVPTGGRLTLQWPGAELPQYGDRVQFRGSVRNLDRARNPGSFDTLAIRKREGIYSSVSIRYGGDAQVIAQGQGNPLVALSHRLREGMERSMALDLDDSPEVVAVIQSTVLGTQAEVSEELLDLFRYTGTIHLFSVSGLHVAMLAALAFTLLQTLGLSRRAVALVVIPVLVGYCFITGLPSASVRATVMASAVMLGLAADRPALPWNLLGASALAILLVDTDQLFRPGFQLSFLLVAALLLGVGRVQPLLVSTTQPDPFLPRELWSPAQQFTAWCGRHGMGALSVSLVAWLGAMPLTLWYFNLWSPSTVPANLVAVALSWVILALGLASGMVGGVLPWLAVVLNNANWLFTKALLGALVLFSSIPGAHRFMEWPAIREKPLCEIVALDMAGGAAIHLRLRMGDGRQHDWMIDCGNAGQMRWSVLPYLRSRGVNRLDGLILTHGDARHLGGASMLMEKMPVGEVLESALKDRSSSRRAFQRERQARSEGRSILLKGDRITLAPGAMLTVLHPPAGVPLRTADDKALVLRLDLTLPGRKEPMRVLFSSDAGFVTAQRLLEDPRASTRLKADIWIKGLHLHDPLGDGELFAAIQPGLVVVGSAAFPKEQQVDEAWAASVEAAGATLMRQEETGAVRIAIDPSGSWSARAFFNGVSRVSASSAASGE